jgi:hypothetical protein
VASQSIAEWLAALPIPWLVARDVGADGAAAEGAVYDEQVALVKEAVKARFPDDGPADALPYMGADRKLIQGYAESDDEFRTRCRTVWQQWEAAGTWAELLFQLYWSCGLDTGSTWIVQQNGYAFNLIANPDADEDPLALLNVTALGDNFSITYPAPVPWWTYDSRDDLCSRFALVIDGPLPGTICVTARAVFDGTSDTATATWSGPWDDTDYSAMSGAPVTTDGTIPLVVVSEKTRTTATVQASAPFTGYVDLLGWLPGSNPFAGPSAQTTNTIRKVVKTWKPAKARYMGAFVLVDGVMWGWPIGTTWGQSGLKWGDSLTVKLDP